jgi:predicted nuclease of predicted toxin-antitoxin system
LPKTIVDENIPRDAKEWLIKKGFEIVSLSQTPLKSAKDFEVVEYAAKNSMAIITLDRGFSKLYHTFKKQQITIIIIRVKPATPTNIIDILNAAQQKINLKEAKNKLIIISKSKIRIIT